MQRTFRFRAAPQPRAAILMSAGVLLAALATSPAAGAAANAGTARIAPSAVSAAGRASCPVRRTGLQAGGPCRYVATLRFAIPADVDAARLRMTLRGPRGIRVRTTSGFAASEPARGAGGAVRIDVTQALAAAHGVLVLTVHGTDAGTTRLSGIALDATVARPPASSGEPSPPAATTPPPATTPAVTPPAVTPPPTPPAPKPAPAPVPPPPAAPPAVPVAPTAGPAVWVSAAGIRTLPMQGAAYAAVKAAADGSLGTPDVADQNSDHDVNTLAAALMFARTQDPAYADKAAAGISAAIGTEAGGRTLALGRNMLSYIVAADLIGLTGRDPAADARFRAWIAAARTEDLQGLTLVATHEQRPNNWGTMAGASRIAADVYLGDATDLQRAAAVFRGYLGDRTSYTGFSFGDLSYQADPARPVGINPLGAAKTGVDIDGAIPDDMRRGCAFQPIPCHTNYAWEAMQGVVMQADLLAHHGLAAFSWSDNAVLRAAQYLRRLDQAYGGWWAATDDQWQPWVINHAYGTALPAAHGGPGKNFGWTDWVYGSGA